MTNKPQKNILHDLKHCNDYYFVKDYIKTDLLKEAHAKKVMDEINKIGYTKNSKNEINKNFQKITNSKKVFIQQNKSIIFLNKRSNGCKHCTEDTGCTIRITKKCNRSCFFCFADNNPPGAKSEINLSKIKELIAKKDKEVGIKSFAISGGEPFLYPKETFELLDHVNNKYNKIYKRIYTNGDFINEDILIKLKSLNVNEIRYSIKPFESPNIELLKLSKKYIPSIVIEMPVLPKTEKYMKNLILKLESLNIAGINLLELFFNGYHAEEFKNKKYKIDLSNGLRSIYDTKPIFEYPINESKKLSLKLIDFFSKKNINIFVNFCSQQTKQLQYQKNNKRIASAHSNTYSTITDDGGIKILGIYGNINQLKKSLSDKKIKDFKIKNEERIETHIKHAKYLLKEECSMAYVTKDSTNSFDVDFEIIQINKSKNMIPEIKELLKYNK